ncbi:MAG: hypothetical protein R2716_14280, partial [Microthrixaceae bacterium]
GDATGFGDPGFAEDFSTDLGTDFTDDFDTGGLDPLPQEPIEPLAEVAAISDEQTDEGDGELAEGEEIAAGPEQGSGDDAALVVGLAALLGAIGLSLGDRIVGLRSRRRIT